MHNKQDLRNNICYFYFQLIHQQLKGKLALLAQYQSSHNTIKAEHLIHTVQTISKLMQPKHNIRVYNSQAAVIQLVGNMRENIQHLIETINCRCGIDGHLRAILTIYSNKINKLRIERNMYRNKYQQLLNQTSTNLYTHPCNPLNSNFYQQNQLCSNEYDHALRNTHFSHNHNEDTEMYRDKQNSNIFQILNKELSSPKSFRYEQNPSIILGMQNQESISVPEDSLLLTQSSCTKLQNYLPSSPNYRDENNRPNYLKWKNQQKNSSGTKSFEQFVQEKVQENHSKLKVTQDILALTNAKINKKSNVAGNSLSTKSRQQQIKRQPFVNRFSQICN